jgi:hypothetical protein
MEAMPVNYGRLIRVISYRNAVDHLCKMGSSPHNLEMPGVWQHIAEEAVRIAKEMNLSDEDLGSEEAEACVVMSDEERARALEHARANWRPN